MLKWLFSCPNIYTLLSALWSKLGFRNVEVYAAQLLNIYLCWHLTSPSRTWWWVTRPVSCAPCWRSITPWRTASLGTGTTWNTCGTTPSAQRSSISTLATARSCWPNLPWIPPRTVRKSSRFVEMNVCLQLEGIFVVVWGGEKRRSYIRRFLTVCKVFSHSANLWMLMLIHIDDVISTPTVRSFLPFNIL